MYGVMWAEIVCVALLCLPMPNNNIRGFVIRLYKRVWTERKTFRTVIVAVLLLQLISFVDAVRNVNELGDHDHTGALGELMNYNRLLMNQRNAYLTGFGLLCSVLTWRILELMRQLYEAREFEKEVTEDYKED